MPIVHWYMRSQLSRRVGVRPLVAVVAALVVLSGCDWPMFRNGPERRGHNNVESKIRVDNVGLLAEAATAPTGGTVSSSPAIVKTTEADHTAYVGSGDGKLYAFAALSTSACSGTPSTCPPLWTGTTGGPIESSPAVVGGVAYVGSNDGKLYAFDGSGTQGCSGTPVRCTPLWTASTGGSVRSSPAVVDGVVYVGSDDDRLYAFDAAGATGCGGAPKVCLPLWTATTGGDVRSSPAVSGGLVLVGSNDDKLYAFDAAGTTGCSGAPKVCLPRWTGATGGDVSSTPAIAGGVAYVGSGGGKLYAFDATGTASCSGTPKTCAPLWTATTGGPIRSSAAVADGVVHVGSDDGKLYAFDAAGGTGCSGTPRTCTALRTAPTGGPVSSSPAVANGVVYVGSNDDRVYAFDAKGSVGCTGSPRVCTSLWSARTGGDVLSSPTVLEGFVYVGSNDARVHIYTGTPRSSASKSLYGWYSSTRGDYFTTTDPAWAPGTAHSGYVFQRVEGKVFDAALAQPRDSVALNLWWSPTRLDNFTTSDPLWAQGTTHSGYEFVRREGYVFADPLAGTTALRSRYNATLGDNRATTNPDNPPSGYGAVYRTEGYINTVDNPLPQDAEFYGYNRKPVTGTRPLLVLLVEGDGFTFAANRTLEHFDKLIFGPSTPNIPSYFRSNSNGAFTFQKAAILGPLTRSPGHTSFADAAVEVMRNLVSQGQFDFAPYDTDHDGTVTVDELQVLTLNEDLGFWGQTTGSPPRFCPTGSSVCVQTMISGGGQHSDLANIAHELTHGLGEGLEDHIYGNIAGTGCNSPGLSVMSCTGWSPTGTTESLRVIEHMDPYNKMNLGWVKPIVVSTADPGGCRGVAAPTVSPTPDGSIRTLLIADPNVRTRFFLVEFRAPDVGDDSDKNVAGRGVAVWYVEKTAVGTNVRSDIVGGTIGEGPDGMLQTQLKGDDKPVDINGVTVEIDDAVAIQSGPNRFPDSVPAGDDTKMWDAADWVVSAPNGSTPAGARGASNLWDSGDAEFGMLLANGLANPMSNANGSIWFRIGTTTSTAASADVQWRRKDQGFRPRVDTVAPSAVDRGSTFSVYGVLGTDPSGGATLRNLTTGSITDLPKVGWSCDLAIFTIPSTVAAGSYAVRLYADTGRTAGSNETTVTVR